MLRLWLTEEMRWRQNRLHLAVVLIVDLLAVATWSLPAIVIGGVMTGWLVFRIWSWNRRRGSVPA